MSAPLAIGTKTPWGRIAAVGFLSGPPPERYYWTVKRGEVAMMPASTVEPIVRSEAGKEKASGTIEQEQRCPDCGGKAPERCGRKPFDPSAPR